MIPAEKSLDNLQQWMLAAITEPEGLAAEPSEVAALVTSSQQQSATQRLNIYHHAYFARLLEVLRNLLPCARFAAGDEQFDLFAIDYLQRHPPHSYTLTHLADQFANFLDATRPPDWGDFLVELVRLEQAIERIFDGPGPENLPPFRLPAQTHENLRLHFVPSFELHAFRYAVSRFYTDWKANQSPHWPEMQPQFIALYRRDYIVRRWELSTTQFQLLSAIHEGDSVLEALQKEWPDSDSKPADELARDLQGWFTDWSARGFFAEAK